MTGIRCITGGEPSRTGKILLSSYSCIENMEQLMEIGSISRLEDSLSVTKLMAMESDDGHVHDEFLAGRIHWDSPDRLNDWLDDCKKERICNNIPLMPDYIYVYDADDKEWCIAQNIGISHCVLTCQPLTAYLQMQAEAEAEYTVRLHRDELEEIIKLAKAASCSVPSCPDAEQKRLKKIRKKLKRQLDEQLKAKRGEA